MKNRFLIPFCVIALLVIGLFWLYNYKEKLNPVLSPNDSNTNAPTVENKASPNVRAHQMDPKAGVASTATHPTPPQTIDSGSVEEKMRAAIETKNIPFDFFGRVVDQDSNSLPGVNFKLGVRHWSAATLGAIHIEKETDANGRFDIHDMTGDAFDIEGVGKEGYELEPGQRGFGAVGGSFNEPVIFKMWSVKIHEQLITGGKSFHIEPDGRPYFIDLAKGTIAESGEGALKVWVKYPTETIRGQTYDWSCNITAINGGLLEETNGNSSMFVAPTEGYTPAFQLQYQLKGGQRGSSGERRFYLKLNKGQEYGRITIEIFAPYNTIPGLVRIQYAINPSGSRILR